MQVIQTDISITEVERRYAQLRFGTPNMLLIATLCCMLSLLIAMIPFAFWLLSQATGSSAKGVLLALGMLVLLCSIAIPLLIKELGHLKSRKLALSKSVLRGKFYASTPREGVATYHLYNGYQLLCPPGLYWRLTRYEHGHQSSEIEVAVIEVHYDKNKRGFDGRSQMARGFGVALSAEGIFNVCPVIAQHGIRPYVAKWCFTLFSFFTMFGLFIYWGVILPVMTAASLSSVPWIALKLIASAAILFVIQFGYFRLFFGKSYSTLHVLPHSDKLT